jgi:hypothetical protein
MLVELDSGKERYSALAGISAGGDARQPPLRHLVGEHDGERLGSVGDDDGASVATEKLLSKSTFPQNPAEWTQ